MLCIRLSHVSEHEFSAYYEHPTDAIDAARRELENDIAIRLLNVTASPVSFF